MKPGLLVATANTGKIKEILALLLHAPFQLFLPTDLGITLEVEETGQSYTENACLKAVSYAQATGILTLADDSGLEVAALGGKPGIYSARFSPITGATDLDRRQYLLSQLQGVSRPWLAHFRCVVALAVPKGPVFFTEGVCRGQVIPEERGKNGFGYDPIFQVAGLEITMAELSSAEKNKLSHRARAILAAWPIISYLLKVS